MPPRPIAISDSANFYVSAERLRRSGLPPDMGLAPDGAPKGDQ